MNLAIVDRIVNALLYEGYILYPYRASSVKNKLRFNFGVLYPKAHAEAQSGSDAWFMQTQCLVQGGPSASLEICVRFLRVINRSEAGQTWQEAVECRIDLPRRTLAELAAAPVHHAFFRPAEQDHDGAILRSKEALQGVIEARVDGSRITVRIVNATELPPDLHRDAALSRSLLSAHTVLGIEGGEFISSLEPPDDQRDAVAQCENIGTFPVLVGQPGEKDTVLSSPIILYDYPAIAPESPGDLCDSCEIDEILTLRVLTLTDEEKNEARHTDERARRILDRAESLDAEQFAKLHGTFRSAGGAP